MISVRWSRRRFIATGALATAAAAWPTSPLRAAAKYTRYNLTSSDGQRMLEGYATAIKAMLALPPTNPHNWYRNTLVHTLDCPHGNWWFLPWHRGYLGYFEQTVRKYSGMADFAFPYWDWTALPRIPADFFGNTPLDPTSSNYIQSYDEFKRQFEGPINALYAGFSAAQTKQLKDRGIDTPAAHWSQIDPANPNGGYFFPGSAARCLTASQPSFAAPPGPCDNACKNTPDAVSQETITSALAPTNFIDFGSGVVDQHSEMTTQGVLEGQPHNWVHNCIGGFMGDLMSPVDPLFMMHHSNIERLWLVWTAKQQGLGLPTLPEGALLAKWGAQPFLFYIDVNGQTLSTLAGDFSQVGSFDYTYTEGSGTPLVKSAKARKVQRFAKEEAMPITLVQEAAAAASGDGPELFAEVPIDPGGRQKGKIFHVLINPPKGLDPTDSESPHHVASIVFFGGGHGHSHGVTNFVVPLSPALRKLRAAGRLAAADQIRLFVAVEDRKSATKAKLEAKPIDAKVFTS